MDITIVEKRQSYTIYADLQTGVPGVGFSGFKRTIILDFIPDEMIVKYISYFNTGNDTNVSYLYSDLVGDILGPIIEATQTINTKFPIKKPVSSLYTFTIFNMAGDPSVYRVGDIVIGLEFVKYGEVKPAKIY